MNILLTGATGFIGSNVRDFLKGGEFIVSSFMGDITKVEDWRKNLEGNFDAIIHLAGVRTESETDLKINLGGVKALQKVLQTVSKYPKVLIFISSQAIYVGSKPPFKENLKLKPKTHYGISKLKAEILITQIGKEHNIRTVIFRPSPVLGKGVRQKSRMSGPLYIFIKKATQNEPIEIFQDGNQTRDYVSVSDVSKAILLALKNKKMVGIFNIGGGKRVKVIDLAKWVIEASKSKSRVILKGNSPSTADPKDLFSDTQKIKKFGWKVKKSLKETINSLFDQDQANQNLHSMLSKKMPR